MILILSEKPFFFTMQAAASAMGLNTCTTYRAKNTEFIIQGTLFFFFFCYSIQSTSDLSLDLRDHLYGVAVIRSCSNSHHGEKTCSCADIQNDDSLASSLHPANCCSNALVIFLILMDTKHSFPIPQINDTWDFEHLRSDLDSWFGLCGSVQKPLFKNIY